jgi:selenide,water dikinase
LVEAGFVTGASDRNWASYDKLVQLPEGDSANMRKLLTDPQTSGGLLVACAPEAANAVLDIFRAKGFAQAAVIGRLEAGAPGVKVIK